MNLSRADLLIAVNKGKVRFIMDFHWYATICTKLFVRMSVVAV